MKTTNRILFFLITFCTLAFYGCEKKHGLIASEGFIDVEGGKVWYKIIGEGVCKLFFEENHVPYFRK